jgi:hypothetical protein
MYLRLVIVSGMRKHAIYLNSKNRREDRDWKIKRNYVWLIWRNIGMKPMRLYE